MSTELNQKPFAGLDGQNTNENDMYETAELASPDSGVHDTLDPEEKARLVEEWKTELAKTEEEIKTLRQVLTSKIHHAQALKRNLGITPAQELRTDIQQTLQTVRTSDAVKKVEEKLSPITHSDAYQKTSAAIKTAGHKTAEVTHKVSDNMKAKMSDLKNSQMYKSFEEKMSLGYTNIKARVSSGAGSDAAEGGSAGVARPSNFDKILDEEDGAVAGGGVQATSKSAPVTPTVNGGNKTMPTA